MKTNVFIADIRLILIVNDFYKYRFLREEKHVCHDEFENAFCQRFLLLAVVLFHRRLGFFYFPCYFSPILSVKSNRKIKEMCLHIKTL